MPYNAKQVRLFQAAAHNPDIARKTGIPKKTAARLLTHAKHAPVKKSVMKD